MIEKLKLAFREARTKVTTYVALAIAGVAQLAEHAEDLVTTWPQMRSFLPPGPRLDSIAHGALTILGLLVVVTRIRRIIWPKT